MMKTNYCNREGALALYETLQNEQDRDTFLYGFYSAISFAHYLSLDDVEKSIYCNETLERVLETSGKDILNMFLEEHKKGYDNCGDVR